MRINKLLVPAILLAMVVPSGAAEKHKKKGAERGMLERMEAVPCGAKQRGFTGIGSIFDCFRCTNKRHDGAVMIGIAASIQ